MQRIPVFAGTRDEITGYVLKDELLTHMAGGDAETPLSELRRDILAVERSLPLPQLFDRLLSRRQHIVNTASFDEFEIGSDQVRPSPGTDTPVTGVNVYQAQTVGREMRFQGREYRQTFRFRKLQPCLRLQYEAVPVNRKMDRIGTEPVHTIVPGLMCVREDRADRPIRPALYAKCRADPTGGAGMPMDQNRATGQESFDRRITPVLIRNMRHKCISDKKRECLH